MGRFEVALIGVIGSLVAIILVTILFDEADLPIQRLPANSDDMQDSTNASQPAAPNVADTTNNNSSVPSLSQQEKKDALNILQDDPTASAILQQAKWDPMVGVWQKDGIAKGAAILLKFKERQWIRGSFYDPSLEKTVEMSQWVGSMHAYIDMDENKLKGIAPVGISRPPDSLAQEEMIPERFKDDLHEDLDENTLDDIKRVSTQYAKTKHGIDGPYHIILNGYQKNKSHPDGVAFVTVSRDTGPDDGSKKAMVAIDMPSMSVIEKYSGEIVDLPRD